MATTSMWKVEKRLDQVIKYTTDKDKTNKENYDDNTIYKSLHNVIEYAKSNFKTEQQLYVTGVNCSEENAFKEMTATMKMLAAVIFVMCFTFCFIGLIILGIADLLFDFCKKKVDNKKEVK